ncbi:uncharacterized protein VTP21DRAFT_8481 [Calcarisporiella thermophila]|uniref:uncharacterized protein n=1 Tax=Calcarisporiella thermophila TaxID=911321 RepID=UPI003742A700
MTIPIQAYIDRACDPMRYEPDLALNLEICDIIVKKAGNTPRDAAMHIVKLINNRNLNVSLLALTLLDHCVKNCGYPFHLQIATKEFLNELVKRFPERPPAVPNASMHRILQMIGEWKMTLCSNSRHREDLIHIKDMYRLLSFKGYRFPAMRDDSVAALNPSENLKSAEELEEEDRVAQSAKLQELIRRGRPEDLVKANELMKIMVGYEKRGRPNYRQQMNEQLEKIHQKALLLNDMLSNVRPGDNIGGDIYEEMASACKVAQSKLQKIIGDEENPESIEKLLMINDTINSVLDNYANIRNGIYSTEPGASPIAPGNMEKQIAAVTASLIDLDDFGTGTENTPQQNQANSGDGASNLVDDLLGLSFNDNSASTGFGIGGNIALPLGGASQGLQVGMPTSLSQPTSGVNPVNASAFNTNPASQNLDFFSSTPAKPISPTPSNDSWAFASPRPQSANSVGSNSSQTASIPSSVSANAPSNSFSVMLMDKNGLRVELDVKRGDSNVQLHTRFSNTTTVPMNDLTFHLAVPKSQQLRMERQSSHVLPPLSQDGVTQMIHIQNPNREPLRIRYKVNYTQNGVKLEETGEFSKFS